MSSVISAYGIELIQLGRAIFVLVKSQKFVNSHGNTEKTSEIFVYALVCVWMSFTLNCSGDIASELKG